jgi:hypothetical protein
MPHAILASSTKRKAKQLAGKTEPPADKGAFIFGGQAIANALGCSLETFYYLHSKGVFDGIVVRLGHKTLIASREKLQALPELLSNKT